MCRRAKYRIALAAALLIACAASPAARAQQVVDRIAARVESDIILLSEVRELGAYQLLVNGKKETDAQLLERLIDQWVVRREAEASHFPKPSDDEIERELERVKASLGPPEQFTERLRQSGLDETELHHLLEEQLYLTNYLDSRFRPAVQIDPKAIEEFYEKNVVPLAKQRGEEPPSLDSARDSIREALIQHGITEQADRWLKESRARLHVEKEIS